MLERFADAIAAEAVSVLHVVVQAVSVLQLLAVVGQAVSVLQVWSIQSISKKLNFNFHGFSWISGHGCLEPDPALRPDRLPLEKPLLDSRLASCQLEMFNVFYRFT